MKNKIKRVESKRLEYLDKNEASTRNIYATKSLMLSDYIQNFIEGKNFKQKDIADKLEMAESQVSKWLSGFHNLTLKSILKLESASSIQILNPLIFKKVATSSINTYRVCDSKDIIASTAIDFNTTAKTGGEYIAMFSIEVNNGIEVKKNTKESPMAA